MPCDRRGGENARSPPNPYRANADIQNGYARARLAFNGTDRLANLACEVPIGRLSLDDYAGSSVRERADLPPTGG